MANKYLTKIITNVPIAEGVYSMAVESGEIARGASAGQFLHIKCGHSRLLRRPISICEIRGDAVRLVFEAKGEGTKWLAKREVGQTLDILGPLGNGFALPAPPLSAPPDGTNGKIIVVGGGIGSPPMLFAAQSAKNEAKSDVTAILGFRDKSKIILTDEFSAICERVIVTTDDGSAGMRGFVTEPLEKLLTSGEFDAVLSCGAYEMQKAVAAICKRFGVPCQVSLEERMACGVGACLVCACSATKDGAEEMSRVCADGPVYDAETVNWR